VRRRGVNDAADQLVRAAGRREAGTMTRSVLVRAASFRT
jgi:hypothetical protein